MTWLVLCVVSLSAFAHVIRYGQRRGGNVTWMATFGYWTAAAACAAWWVLQREGAFGYEQVVFGALGGTVATGAFFLFNRSIRLAGVGAAQSVGRVSVIIPVLASIFYWGETPEFLRVAGVALAVVSLPLLTQGRKTPGGAGDPWKVPTLLAYLVAVGVFGVVVKAYAERISAGGEAPFLTFFYLSAGLFSLIGGLVRDGRPNAADAAHGVLLGLVNLATKVTLLRALAALEGSVVFPSVTAGTIVLTILSAMALWRERYARRALIGMGLAVLGLVLIHVGGGGG